MRYDKQAGIEIRDWFINRCLHWGIYREIYTTYRMDYHCNYIGIIAYY